MTAPIDFYFASTPNGWKMTIALEEFGLPFAVRPVDLHAGDQFKPAFLAISPNNKIPVIVDHDGPDGKPISVFESGAILQYLGRKTGKFYPKDERARVEVDQWLFWQTSSVGPMGGQAAFYVHAAPKMVADQAEIAHGVARYVKEYNRLLGVMNRRLADRPYLAGEYSIADMACYPWIYRADHMNQDLGDFPNVKGWVERVAARPAVKRAIEYGESREGHEEDSEAQRNLYNQTAASVAAASKQS